MQKVQVVELEEAINSRSLRQMHNTIKDDLKRATAQVPSLTRTGRPEQETAAILVAERITGNIANGKAWNRNCNTELNLHVRMLK